MLASPARCRKSQPVSRPIGKHATYVGIAAAVAFVACLSAAIPSAAQSGTKDGEWRFYAGDSGSTKYSPLDQISKENVRDLHIAWRWKGQPSLKTPACSG